MGNPSWVADLVRHLLLYQGAAAEVVVLGEEAMGTLVDQHRRNRAGEDPELFPPTLTAVMGVPTVVLRTDRYPRLMDRVEVHGRDANGEPVIYVLNR